MRIACNKHRLNCIPVLISIRHTSSIRSVLFRAHCYKRYLPCHGTLFCSRGATPLLEAQTTSSASKSGLSTRHISDNVTLQGCTGQQTFASAGAVTVACISNLSCTAVHPSAIIARLLPMSSTYDWHCTCRLHTIIAPACVRLCSCRVCEQNELACVVRDSVHRLRRHHPAVVCAMVQLLHRF